MYCLHPISVRQWRQVVDHVQEGDSDLATHKSYRTNSLQLVPCGKCVACLARKRNEWTYRLTKESEKSDYTYFGTLTYDNDNIPVRVKNGIPYLVFRKSDVQKYLKRVRYFISEISSDIWCSYYLVSEYGGHGHRPHYHFLWFVHGDRYLQHKKQIDMILRDCWQLGFVTFKPANQANIHYVTKYCVKDLEQIPEDCIDPVFILASKRPYIGSIYEPILQSQVDQSSLEPKVFNNGFPAAMPRIYRQKLGAAGLSVQMSDIDPRLTREQELNFVSCFMRNRTDFSLTEFHEYVNRRLYAMEKNAERRQLQRNEKL